MVVVSITIIVSIVVIVPIVVVSMTVIVASIVVSMTVIVVMPAALVIRLVFSGPYEVHRPVARIVLSAMLAPIPRMAGRHV
jgi:hypothetical protein